MGQDDSWLRFAIFARLGGTANRQDGEDAKGGNVKHEDRRWVRFATGARRWCALVRGGGVSGGSEFAQKWDISGHWGLRIPSVKSQTGSNEAMANEPTDNGVRARMMSLLCKTGGVLRFDDHGGAALVYTSGKCRGNCGEIVSEFRFRAVGFLVTGAQRARE